MDRGDEILPFVRCFNGSPSTYLWEDEVGMSHDIAQGEPGDPLMPMLIRIGIAPSSKSSPRQDASGRENLRAPGRCVRDLQTTTGCGGFQDP